VQQLAVSDAHFPGVSGLWALAEASGGVSGGCSLLVLSFLGASRALAAGAAAPGADGGAAGGGDDVGALFADVSEEVGLQLDQPTLGAAVVAPGMAVQVCPRGCYLFSLDAAPAAEAGGHPHSSSARNVRHSPLHSPQGRWPAGRGGGGGGGVPLARQALFAAAAAGRHGQLPPLGGLGAASGAGAGPTAGDPDPPGLWQQAPGSPMDLGASPGPLGPWQRSPAVSPMPSLPPGLALAEPACEPGPGLGHGAVGGALPGWREQLMAHDTSSGSSGVEGAAPAAAAAGGRDASVWSPADWQRRQQQHQQGRQPGAAAPAPAAAGPSIVLAAFSGSLVALSLGAPSALVVLQAVSGSGAAGGAGSAMSDTAASPQRGGQRKRGRSHWELAEVAALQLPSHQQLSCLQLAPAGGGAALLVAGSYDGSILLYAVRPAAGKLLAMCTLGAGQLHPAFGVGGGCGGGEGAAPVPHSLAVLPAGAGGGGGDPAPAAAGGWQAAEGGAVALVVSYRDGCVALYELSLQGNIQCTLLSHRRVSSVPLQLQLLPPGAQAAGAPAAASFQLLALGDWLWLLEASPTCRRLACSLLPASAGLLHVAAMLLPAAALPSSSGGGSTAAAGAAALSTAPPPSDAQPSGGTGDGGLACVLVCADDRSRLQLARLSAGDGSGGGGDSPASPPVPAPAAGHYRVVGSMLEGHQVRQLLLHPTSQLLLAVVSAPSLKPHAAQVAAAAASQRWPPPWHGLFCVCPTTGEQCCASVFPPEESLACMSLWDTAWPAAAPAGHGPAAAAADGVGGGGSPAATDCSSPGGSARGEAARGSGGRRRGAGGGSRHCLELRHVFTRFVRLNMAPGPGGDGGGGGAASPPAPSSSAQQAPVSHPFPASSSGAGRSSGSFDGAPGAPMGPLIVVGTRMEPSRRRADEEGGAPARGCLYVLQLSRSPAGGAPGGRRASQGSSPDGGGGSFLAAAGGDGAGCSGAAAGGGGGGWGMSLVARLRMPGAVTAVADAGRGELSVAVGGRVALYRLTKRGSLACICHVTTYSPVISLTADARLGLLAASEQVAGLVVRQLLQAGAGQGPRLMPVAADGAFRRLVAAAVVGGSATPGDGLRALVLEEAGRVTLLQQAGGAAAGAVVTAAPVPAALLAAGASYQLPAAAGGWCLAQRGPGGGAAAAGPAGAAAYVLDAAGGVTRVAWLPGEHGELLQALQHALLQHAGARPLGAAAVGLSEAGGAQPGGDAGTTAASAGGEASRPASTAQGSAHGAPQARRPVEGRLLRLLLALPHAQACQVAAAALAALGRSAGARSVQHALLLAEACSG
jgi:hypothetical protein